MVYNLVSCFVKQQQTDLLQDYDKLQFVLGYASSGGRFIRLLVDGWSL
jgi:hypothetical protein